MQTIIELPQTPYSSGLYRIMVNGHVEQYTDYALVKDRIDTLIEQGAVYVPYGEAA